MLQCKIFSGSDPTIVETDVNRFLNDHSKLMLHSVLQSSDQSGMHVTLFFYVRTKAVRLREASIQEIAMNIKPSEIPSN